MAVVPVSQDALQRDEWSAVQQQTAIAGHTTGRKSQAVESPLQPDQHCCLVSSSNPLPQTWQAFKVHNICSILLVQSRVAQPANSVSSSRYIYLKDGHAVCNCILFPAYPVVTTSSRTYISTYKIATAADCWLSTVT
jgi:hypothetical protein